MKKLLIGVSVLLFAFGAVADTWTDPATGIEWTYTVKNGEATVGDERYSLAVPKSTSGAIVIPSTLGGCSVTSIGGNAFCGCEGLTSVTIPSGVTSIGNDAFCSCWGLTSVTIPSGVTSIGRDAFSCCSVLTSVIIPSSVTSIGEGAFDCCGQLGEILVATGNRHYTSVDGVLFNKSQTEIIAYPSGKSGHYYAIPSSVKSIGDLAFSGCSGLTSVTFPSGVTNIGYRAFMGCSGMTSVTIPSSVTSISHDAFCGCSGLTSVVIPSGVTSIEWDAFGACGQLGEILVATGNRHYTSVDGVLFNKSQTEIIAYPGGKSGHYTIPSGVTSIEWNAFDGCHGLTSVTIPSGVTSISHGAFYDCRGLTSVTIPSGVTRIGDMAFCCCWGLTSVTIPSGVTSIGNSAFDGCGLTSVVIPSGVTSIGTEAFFWCHDLTSVTIPSSVTRIGNQAFSECEALKTVYVAKGDTQRVKKMLEESGFDTSNVTFVENLDPTPGPTPTPTPEPEPEEEEAFKTAHTFGGLVTDEVGMCGMIQVATARKSAKGEVKVSGFVMLEDGKRQSIKAVSAKVSGGAVAVTTKAGKTSLSLTITDDGFTGTLGDMTVASAEIGEETGIVSGTLKMSYFDAKTGKVKTKSIKISGLASGSIAEGTLTVGKEEPKSFAAEIE